MPLQIINRDITTVKCDVIVNPTDCCFSGRGGTDLAIHRAAGKKLDAACAELEPIDSGEIAVTPAFDLPAKYLIHTMGPIWEGGEQNEAVLLRSSYINALVKAKRLGAESIAFPLISSGTFGFPKDKVLRIAIDAISDFLFTTDGEMNVFICVINRRAFELSKDIALREYLNRSLRFVYEDHALKAERNSIGSFQRAKGRTARMRLDGKPRRVCGKAFMPEKDMCAAPAAAKPMPAKKAGSLAELIKKMDDTFAVMLLKLIDEKGMDDVECYKKANVSKNTFWKINNDPKYKPSKPTVIAFAIALELSIEETSLLLRSAGFALSGNNCFDVIIEFYISNGIYDIFEINSALYQYDQPCLGC